MSTGPDPATQATRTLLGGAFAQVHDLVGSLADGLTPELAGYRPDEVANPVGWLLWHLTRVQDDHVAELAGVGQAWPRWRERFALPFDADETGYGQGPEDVVRVQVPAELLTGYHDDVHALTTAYLERVDADELARVVDTSWDPPVTAGVRLVSVLGDTLAHLGQAGYVRGLAERAQGAG